MKRLLLLPILLLIGLTALHSEPICGPSTVKAEALAQFVAKRNPGFDPRIAEAFVTVGSRYGIRGDVALCQAILETGWFRFDGGTAVRPEQNNFCGLGVTKLGIHGCAFASIEEGVEAMMQHLWAYASTAPLPEGAPTLDPRFSLVTRGCAPTWEQLSGRWAINPDYGTLILRLYERLLDEAGIDTPTESAAAATVVSVPEPEPDCHADEPSLPSLF